MLTGLSTVGLASVVGCLDDGQQLTIGVGPSGTRSHQAGKALAVAVDRHSDRLTLRIESIGPPSQRLYALADGEIAATGVDNTTLYRASEDRSVFDLDPIEALPHQGFAYSYREHYWLAVDDQPAAPASTAELTDHVVHPGQPSKPSRLVTEQLLRESGLWERLEIDNRPHAEVAGAVDQRAVTCLVAAQHSGQQRTSWSQAVDEQVGDRLASVSVGAAFQEAISDAPNAVDREIEPVGWEDTAMAESVDGWVVPSQWLWSPSIEPAVVAELTQIAAEHSETLGEVDPLALDGEPDSLAGGVISGLAVHEGAVDAFDVLGSPNSDWTVGDAVD